MDNSVSRPSTAFGGAYTQSGQERPLSEILSDIIGNAEEMLRSELRLARAEIREEASQTALAGAVVAAGIVIAILALLFLLVCVALVLGLVMPDWAATLLIAATLAIAAAVLIAKGRERLKVPVPDKMIASVKENVEWMKNQTRS